jgi:hypothetical protein
VSSYYSSCLCFRRCHRGSLGRRSPRVPCRHGR